MTDQFSRPASAPARHVATADRLPFPLPARDLPTWELELLALIPGRHRLELDGDNGQLPAIPATYVDAYRGWVREVPGTWINGWFMVEVVATGEVVR